ncbi:unnamed protein product [Parnassius apollo]|uniref:(apollo) hypothetical protein n=1 Tax=Parnassius apollo TaxID=110799 RepID=A0A8S3Y282_PARAO|nr:unnamed protein product [Parnassius apollo]
MAVFCVLECTVLDPALYLSPSPPIKFSSSPELMWSKFSQLSVKTTPEVVLEGLLNKKKEVTLAKARLFWPKIRTDYSLGSIHIPLTFSLSGHYGRYGTGGLRAIGTSYASMNGVGTSKLISSLSKPQPCPGYETINSGQSIVRVYGANNKPTWSGWGNGKWGHYGKG